MIDLIGEMHPLTLLTHLPIFHFVQNYQ